MATSLQAPTRRSTAWYFGLLAGACLIWAAQGTAVKFLDRHMGPIAITFVPFYVATLLMAPLLLRDRRHKARATAEDWKKFAVAGVGGQ